MTGLIKAALCLSRRTLVPTANYETLNAKVDLANGPFFVHEGGAAEWPAPAHGGPRIAGVSSFGIGGANVHMVLQEPPPLQLPSPPPTTHDDDEASRREATRGSPADRYSIVPCVRNAHVLTLSAKTAGSLARACTELANHLADRLADHHHHHHHLDEPSLTPPPQPTRPPPTRTAGHMEAVAMAPLGRVAHTLHLGREAFAHRASVTVSTAADAIGELRSAAAGAAGAAAAGGGGLGSARKPPSVVFVFPGQGSQCPRMGEGLYVGEPVYREHIDRLCETLKPMLGYDLRDQLYPPANAEADPAFIAHFNSPTVTQPAIFVTELALGLTLIDMGVRCA